MNESTQQAFGRYLVNIGLKIPNLVLITCEGDSILKTAKFAKLSEERHIRMGISESDAIGTAAGLALQGKIPLICGLATTLIPKSLSQIRNLICLHNLNIKIIGANSGILSSAFGPVIHSIEDIALLRPFPNLKIFSPADANQLKSIFQYMLNDFAPAYLRLSSLEANNIFAEDYQFQEEKIDCLAEGKDLLIISSGSLAGECTEAADLLKKNGIAAHLINIPCLKPLNKEKICEISQKFRHIVVVEDHRIHGGIGSLIAETIASQKNSFLHFFGIEEIFTEYGKPQELLEKYRLSAAKICDRIRRDVL